MTTSAESALPAAATAVTPSMVAATDWALASEVAAMRTLCPARAACEASAEPMLPAPRIKRFMVVSLGKCPELGEDTLLTM